MTYLCSRVSQIYHDKTRHKYRKMSHILKISRPQAEYIAIFQEPSAKKNAIKK
jgi:hypothetical protein